MKTYKEYGFNGLAGCVTQHRSRKTGVLVGLYQADQAGMESDPESPWATVCEAHNTLVCHASLSAAKNNMSDTTMWCEQCQEAEEKQK